MPSPQKGETTTGCLAPVRTEHGVSSRSHGTRTPSRHSVPPLLLTQLFVLAWATCHTGGTRPGDTGLCPGDTPVHSGDTGTSAANAAGTQGFPGVWFVLPSHPAPRCSPRLSLPHSAAGLSRRAPRAGQARRQHASHTLPARFPHAWPRAPGHARELRTTLLSCRHCRLRGTHGTSGELNAEQVLEDGELGHGGCGAGGSLGVRVPAEEPSDPGDDATRQRGNTTAALPVIKSCAVRKTSRAVPRARGAGGHVPPAAPGSSNQHEPGWFKRGG